MKLEEVILDERYICKALRIDNREFVEGFPVHVHSAVDSSDKFCILSTVNGSSELIPVFSWTLCRFIGKIDTNNHRVFENDMVEWKSTSYYSAKPYLVKYDNDNCRYILVTDKDRIPIFDNLSVTIVGNILLDGE